MKKYLPFLFPTIALVIVLFLAWRWYNMRTINQRNDAQDISETGATIENLSTDEKDAILKGTGTNMKSLDLTTEGEMASESAGMVRYEVKDGAIRFSIQADLPILDQGMYQVWLKESGAPGFTKAFVLEFNKGGYTGAAAITVEKAPYELVVTKELTDDNTMEVRVLSGSLENTVKE